MHTKIESLHSRIDSMLNALILKHYVLKPLLLAWPQDNYPTCNQHPFQILRDLMAVVTNSTPVLFTYKIYWQTMLPVFLILNINYATPLKSF
jgi:hypothetical protein